MKLQLEQIGTDSLEMGFDKSPSFKEPIEIIGLFEKCKTLIIK